MDSFLDLTRENCETFGLYPRFYREDYPERLRGYITSQLRLGNTLSPTITAEEYRDAWWSINHTDLFIFGGDELDRWALAQQFMFRVARTRRILTARTIDYPAWVEYEINSIDNPDLQADFTRPRSTDPDQWPESRLVQQRHRLNGPHYVHVAEVGAERNTKSEYSQALFFGLHYCRFSNNFPTVITSPLDIESFSKKYRTNFIDVEVVEL